MATLALLSDFSNRDWYVAAMRGVCAALAPEARLLDITHAVPPGDVSAGAFILSQCWRCFPANTVFLAVVDPGVGTERLPLAWRASEGQIFVGPDNGLFSFLVDSGTARAIQPPSGEPGAVSSTFHGRDIFAPAAARLAAGSAFEAVGPVVADPVVNALPQAVESASAWLGEVQWVDHYGNLITNLDQAICTRFAEGATLRLSVGEQALAVPYRRTFGEVPPEAPVAYLGSGGLLELALNGGSLARRLNEGRGARVVLRKP
ncbi:MAG: S-adenosyl-l-methionine hydroxide adenosyltransferase family protein [Opitutales bacterium]